MVIKAWTVFLVAWTSFAIPTADDLDDTEVLSLLQVRSSYTDAASMYPFTLGPHPRFDHGIGVEQHAFATWLEQPDPLDRACSYPSNVSGRCDTHTYQQSPVQHSGAAPRTPLGTLMTTTMMASFLQGVSIYEPPRENKGVVPNRAQGATSLNLGLKVPAVRGEVKMASWPLSFAWEIDDKTLRGTVSCHCMLNSSANVLLPAQWLAMGFSIHGGMPGADIVVARRTANGSIWLEDRYATHFARPTLDAKQDYVLIDDPEVPGGEDPDVFRFTFERKLQTHDHEDWMISAANVRLIFSAGLDDFQHHKKAQEYPQPVNLYQGGVYDSVSDQGQHRFPRSYEELAEEVEKSAVAEADDSGCTRSCFQKAEMKARQGRLEDLNDDELIGTARCLRKCDSSVGRIAALRIFRHVALHNKSVDSHRLQEEALSNHPVARMLLHRCRKSNAKDDMGYKYLFCNIDAFLDQDTMYTLTRILELFKVAGLGLLWLGAPYPMTLKSLLFNNWRRRCLAVLLVLMAALWYVDFVSGAEHINLDNDSLLTWPVLRPCAVGFQGHHYYPSGVQKFPFFQNLGLYFIATTIVSGSVCAVLLIVAASFSFERTRHLYLQALAALMGLVFFSTPLNSYILNTHEWAHTPYDELQPYKQWLQCLGLAPTSRQHMVHHMYFNRDFAVFNGWANPLLNFMLVFMGPRSEHWIWPWIISAFLPALCALAFAIGLRYKSIRPTPEDKHLKMCTNVHA